MDLTGEEPFGDLLDMARTGQFDRSHAGFPCGPFSKVRHRPGGATVCEVVGVHVRPPHKQSEAAGGSRQGLPVGDEEHSDHSGGDTMSKA